MAVGYLPQRERSIVCYHHIKQDMSIVHIISSENIAFELKCFFMFCDRLGLWEETQHGPTPFDNISSSTTPFFGLKNKIANNLHSMKRGTRISLSKLSTFLSKAVERLSSNCDEKMHTNKICSRPEVADDVISNRGVKGPQGVHICDYFEVASVSNFQEIRNQSNFFVTWHCGCGAYLLSVVVLPSLHPKEGSYSFATPMLM